MGNFKITFLGTSCMVPTKDRNHQAFFINYKNEGILIDCGEGTQRQFKIAGIKATKITKIFISHWHGDHIFGLPGLLQTLAKSEFNKKLKIYGPKGTKKFINQIMKIFTKNFEVEYEVIDIKKQGKFLETEDLEFEAYSLEHNTPTLGFRIIEKDYLRINMKKAEKLGLKQGPLIGKLQNGDNIKINNQIIKPLDIGKIEKGKKIGIIADTLLCENCDKIAQDVDLLISEAVYCKDLEEKAKQYFHMTAQQAALIANRSNVKELILTHFSQRYKTSEPLLSEAKELFNNTKAAFDFMKIKL